MRKLKLLNSKGIGGRKSSYLGLILIAHQIGKMIAKTNIPSI
ncbi:MAG: hypothetical protein RMI85_02535 [Candidatus Korarchaeum sp.]|nr:hypothetical protein [Candidatus Korarchaeum sp.]